MSSVAERLRLRPEKRPVYYALDYESDREDDDVTLSPTRRRKRRRKPPERKMRRDPSLTRGDLSDADESNDEDELPLAQIIGMPKAEKPSEKIIRDYQGEKTHDGSDDEDDVPIGRSRWRLKTEKPSEKNLTTSSLAERPYTRLERRPSYNVDESDDEDEVPIARRRRRLKVEKPSEKLMRDDKNLTTSSSAEGHHARSEKNPSYNIDELDDDDEIPIKQIIGRPKVVKPPEKNLTTNSLVERLRTRPKKRRVYNVDESDEDEVPVGQRSGRPIDEMPSEKLMRDGMKVDACGACGESGSLISCGTCSCAFHPKCLVPRRRAISDVSWSCPECVNPLNEVEKILDSEIHSAADNTNASIHDKEQKDVRQYLVKWKGWSYLHCSWVAEDEFRKAFKTRPQLKSRLNNFKAKMESMNSSEDEFIAIRPEWTTVDRVIASRKNVDECEYFVKWKDLGYDECSWENESDISAFQHQIERFHMILSRKCKKTFCGNKNINQNLEDSVYTHKVFHHYGQTPEFLSGGTLHQYQLEGLNFLRYSWTKKTHVILADEMGLGKTIQSIAFLASLFEENITPHIVVAPLSTLRNWEREFATWAPEMNVVMYSGSASARAIARQFEFFYLKEETKKKERKKPFQNANKNKQARIKLDVLLTSYEMINLDSASLKNIQWECMIVDEGHRLKNKDSKLFLQLKLYSTKHRVLLTGTPLQNNLDELFMLMHFLDDGKFPSIEEFQEEFKDINQEEQIAKLHKLLAPHLLRRVKKDVMKDLPPKKELILRVELSNKQKKYYKAILTRNYQILACRGGAKISLMNVIMELRKLCCHAYMLEGVEPIEEPADANEVLRQLLESSGKMQLLDKMMVKLKEEGHRVLIYSQFRHMLDLLGDYLSYKKWNYERIDGKVSGAERQIRIDRFNAKNSTKFCFLLSTRAGGLGINLATADTVFIYDSDWNPHADLQAMARAHRLGQSNKVMIYRLITRGTIEERMMQLTKKKMILEHLVVGRLKAQQAVNQEELDDIIRYGSKELFSDENEEASKSRQIHYDDAAIERLLNRDHAAGEDSSIDDRDDDFLKAFKVANFEYIDEVEAASAKELLRKQPMTEKASSTNSDRANYWDVLLRDRYEVHEFETISCMGKGKRSRKQVAAAVHNDPSGVHATSSEDDDYSYDDLSESETRSSRHMSGNRGHFSRKKARAGYVESLALVEGEGKSLRILGFNQNQRNVFLQTLMRFGFGDYDWMEFLPRLNGKTYEEVHEYGFLFLRHLDEGINDSPTFSDGVPKEGLRVEDVLVRLAQINLIKEKLNILKGNSGSTLFPEDIQECHPSLIGKIWKDEHDILLLEAVLKHGYGRWQAIVDDQGHGLTNVACRELNLPSGGPFAGGLQRNDGSSGAAEISQLHPSNSKVFQLRVVQKRIVDFVRKRYYLLEKLLDLELCLDEAEKAKSCDPTSQDSDIEPTKTGVSRSGPVDTNSISRELPTLEPIAPPEQLLFDRNVERLNMVQLYNGMSSVVETNAIDAVKACFGDTCASSRLSNNMGQLKTLYEDLLGVLSVENHEFALQQRE